MLQCMKSREQWFDASHKLLLPVLVEKNVLTLLTVWVISPDQDVCCAEHDCTCNITIQSHLTRHLPAKVLGLHAQHLSHQLSDSL